MRRLRAAAAFGGTGHARFVLLFACVLALQTADLSSLGAIAGQLKLALHIDNTQLGVLAAAPSLIGALFTLPMGVLADRAPRVRLLSGAIAVWSVGVILSGAATSFTMLLLVRMFLGAVTAAAGPLIASLVGDLFEPGGRGRVYGYIVGGELFGSLVGLLVVGNVAALSWRVGLWVLAVPSVALSVAIRRLLHEPRRGAAGGARGDFATTAPADHGSSHVEALAGLLREQHVDPRPRLVLRRDPTELSWWQAVRYVVRIRTNDLLIVASALGYFFQAGVNTFGVVFLASQFRLAQAEATSLLALVATGALVGTLLGGRLSDRLLARGAVGARMLVGGTAFVLSSAIFVPGLLSRSLAVALPLYFLAAITLATPNAALEAARLDIVPARLRGRAESVRTALRTLAVSAAPLAFGFVSDQLGGGPRSLTKGIAYSVSATGLKYTFMLMLAPMLLGGTLLVLGRRLYARDMATAVASERAIATRLSPRPQRGRARDSAAPVAPGAGC